MELLEYNKLQIKLIIKEYKKMPSNDEVNKWILKYAKSFKSIVNNWTIIPDTIFEILHNNKK